MEEISRTCKRDEKGRQSEAKDVEIFKEDIEGRKEKAVLTALKGAKGWEAVEEKLGKLQSIGNIGSKGKSNLNSLALLRMSSSQLGKVIPYCPPKNTCGCKKSKFVKVWEGRERQERRRVVT